MLNTTRLASLQHVSLWFVLWFFVFFLLPFFFMIVLDGSLWNRYTGGQSIHTQTSSVTPLVELVKTCKCNVLTMSSSMHSSLRKEYLYKQEITCM